MSDDPENADVHAAQADPAEVVQPDPAAADGPLVGVPQPTPVPTAPNGQRDQDVNHLMNYLGEMKAFLLRFEHQLDGKLGEVVSYLKANL